MNASQAAPRRWLALAMLCVAQFMVVLDVSIVNVVLPSIQEDLGFITGFCLVEGRVRAPLVPFRIFRSRTLAGADLVTLVLSAVIGAQGVFFTLYMQQILGYSPLVTGLAFLPLTVAAGVGSTLASRGGAKVTMVSGMALLAIGMALLARISSGGGYLGVLLPDFFFTALGLGLTFVTATIAGTSGVADGEQGLASGLINTAQQVGTSLGLAILVTAAAARTAAAIDPSSVKSSPRVRRPSASRSASLSGRRAVA